MPYFKPLCIPFLILVPQLSNRGCYCTSHIFSNSRFGHLFCLNYSFPLNGVRSSHACMIRIMLLLYGEDIPSNTHTVIIRVPRNNDGKMKFSAETRFRTCNERVWLLYNSTEYYSIGKTRSPYPFGHGLLDVAQHCRAAVVQKGKKARRLHASAIIFLNMPGNAQIASTQFAVHMVFWLTAITIVLEVCLPTI